MEENGKVYAYYVIDVNSKQGWNKPITIHDEFNSDNTLGGTYDRNSFVLTDKSGNKITGHTPVFAADGKSFDLKDLPALQKGEVYKLTYRVEITNNTKDGYGTFCNTAWVRENDKKTVYATHDSYIKKASNYNPDDGYMYWTVTVYNPDGGDLNGKNLSDIIQTPGAEIVGNVTVTQTLNWQQSEFDQITPVPGSTGFDYKFSKEAKGQEYKFTYKTKVPDGVTKVENKSIIDNKYTAEETGTVTDREWKVSKNTVGSLEETATTDLCKGAWSVSSPIPNNWSTCEFIDQIKKPKTPDTDHYGIASELQSEIEQNLSFTLVDGTPLNYQAAKAAGIGIAISYYGVEDPDKSDPKPIQFTDDSSHVQSFKVTLSKGSYNGTAIKSMSISEYHTYMNVAGVAEGSKVEFTNKIKGGSSTKFTYEKKKAYPCIEQRRFQNG